MAHENYNIQQRKTAQNVNTKYEAPGVLKRGYGNKYTIGEVIEEEIKQEQGRELE